MIEKKKHTNLEQGSLNDEAFELLLGLTSIRSEPLIEALRDHYVFNLSKSASYTKHGVDKTIFSRKLRVLEKVFESVIQFLNVYKER
ncbi:adhesin biosynthesis transcription regulatory family protein [Endozoicomonas sp. ONNA1]|uniref:adhesin biosynthesis transcription regulatory family protein n=1 Tax=Endozoicomonas sp. ONNA1 TaxID=2828740 RepID=UPI002149771C|nr:adhesin biosynthesis transcription regulatory family protein [Endozoicomonas sp. ONNA1]